MPLTVLAGLYSSLFWFVYFYPKGFDIRADKIIKPTGDDNERDY